MSWTYTLANICVNKHYLLYGGEGGSMESETHVHWKLFEMGVRALPFYNIRYYVEITGATISWCSTWRIHPESVNVIRILIKFTLSQIHQTQTFVQMQCIQRQYREKREKQTFFPSELNKTFVLRSNLVTSARHLSCECVLLLVTLLMENHLSSIKMLFIFGIKCFDWNWIFIFFCEFRLSFLIEWVARATLSVRVHLFCGLGGWRAFAKWMAFFVLSFRIFCVWHLNRIEHCKLVFWWKKNAFTGAIQQRCTG